LNQKVAIFEALSIAENCCQQAG